MVNRVFNMDIINFVSHYKYLGVEFQQNGKFILAIENRKAKANATLFATKRLCSSGNFEYPSTEMLMTLFNLKNSTNSNVRIIDLGPKM